MLALFALLCACSEEVGHPPVARMVVTPMYIPQNDTFQTSIVLDGGASADEVDDPGATRPLRYQWTIGGEFKVQEGAADAPRMTILLKGDRPVTITLAVTDADDRLTSKSSVTVGITLRP